MSDNFPPIPPILSEELLAVVSALAHAAHSYRSVLFLAADAQPEIIPIMLKHEDLLNLSDRVINAWRKQLGHDIEDEEQGSA
jgi:hypothetical protein